MTTNQVQTEEQRIAEIRRKAQNAHTLYRYHEDQQYKIDVVTLHLIHVSSNESQQHCFAFEDIEPEDKFFELTEIK